jgi:hypothetical protein
MLPTDAEVLGSTMGNSVAFTYILALFKTALI